jgi:glutamate--cysteine ligase
VTLKKTLSSLTKPQLLNSSASSYPFYASIDVRDAGFKMAVCDLNLFPGGFNNLASDAVQKASRVACQYLELHCPQAQNILLIPEQHTHNAFYAQNLRVLLDILKSTGKQIRTGWLSHKPHRFEFPDGFFIDTFEVKNSDNKLSTLNEKADAVFLNHDFSAGFPAYFQSVKTPFFPSFQLGWHKRRKHVFFEHYNAYATQTAESLGIDPWYLTIQTERVEDVDFSTGQLPESLFEASQRILTTQQHYYEKYKIEQKPFVFIKNNSGTYGMGIMKISSLEELHHLNRRHRNKMSIGKNGAKIQSVIVQEGIPSKVSWQNHPAEPVIYMMMNEILGGFLRVNDQKTPQENLNSQGMTFHPLASYKPWELIAQIALQATVLESQNLLQNDR